jgi:hypothetical protein
MMSSLEDGELKSLQHNHHNKDENPAFPRQTRTKDDLMLPEHFEAIGSLEGPFGIYSRAFFVTTNGFMGIGPTKTKEGDQVAVLYGCPCPFVIQPLSSSGRYWFVEECYLYGIMDGLPMEKVQELVFE